MGETITTVTCHIWHADELGYHMVNLAGFSDIDAAKEDARNEALASFSADLSEPHSIWFTETTQDRPVLREPVTKIDLPSLPESPVIESTVSIS